jgi:hypothetical protein
MLLKINRASEGSVIVVQQKKSEKFKSFNIEDLIKIVKQPRAEAVASPAKAPHGHKEGLGPASPGTSREAQEAMARADEEKKK